jgi:hypothetical protein
MTDAELESMIDSMSDADLDRVLSQLQVVDDFLTYSEHNLKVQTPKAQIVPFRLNGPQRILHEIVENHIRPKRLVRIVALKARRMGFSTYFSGLFYHGTSNKPNRYALQITHEPDATDFLFKMVKRFYNLSPKGKRPETRYNNTRLLEFNNLEGTGLNSAFRVATAGKDDVGSGQLIHYLHCSELSKWPAHNTEDLLTAVFPCIPNDPDTAIVFESTAKGIGGEFYDRFWGSRYQIFVKKLDESGNPVIEEMVNEKADAEDVFTSIFLPWFCFEDYRMPVGRGFKLSEDEVTLKARYGLCDQQIVWRRYAIANLCKGRTDVFNQEYPDNPRAAFLGTGRPVFNVHKIVEMMETRLPPTSRYELHANNWIATDTGRLRVWKEPQHGAAYIISGDVAEGLRDGDYCCADVIDHRTGEQVAHWHGHIDCDNVLEFADILSALGRRYNMALVACERNNHGLAVVTQLYHGNYPNLYAEMVPDPPGRPRKRYGWVTTRATRPLIIDNLIREVQDDCTGINNRDTLDEMLCFKIQDNGKMEADSGRHDDRVICLAIGKHIRQVTDLPASRRNQHEKFARGTGQKKRVNPLAWT